MGPPECYRCEKQPCDCKDGIAVYSGDCLALMAKMAPKSVDLVFGSPPYCDARTYGIGSQRDCVAWVDWMLSISSLAARVSRGPVLWVAAGVTRDRNYWPAVEGLMWGWWKMGGEHQLYRPCVFHRVGIPGSGGTDWLRSDWEYVVCMKPPGELAWSDPCVMGHPPKWAPGGEMSHRLTDGKRKNRTMRRADGEMERQNYTPPVLANPGNVIDLAVGGGRMGDPLAHENEAPFPEKLAAFFIRSFCPEGGTVLDPFVGSGTTMAVARKNGRRGIGIDAREEMCEVTQKRLCQGVLF